MSSNLESCGHDGQHGYVKFIRGKTYICRDLDPKHIDELRAAASAGSHFHHHLKGKGWEPTA